MRHRFVPWNVLPIVALFAVVPAVLAEHNGPRETVKQEAFDVSPGATLRIDVPDADLELRPGSSDRVEWTIELSATDMEWARQRFAAMNFRGEAQGNDVVLTADPVRTLWGGGHGHFQVTVRVSHPEAFNLEIETGDGDISVEKIEGNVRVHSGDGDVAIGVGRGSEATIVTGDGDIRAEELDFGVISVRSGDGDVHVTNLLGQQSEVRTSDGDISIDTASGALKARTGDGELFVGLGRFDETTLTSGDGDITIRGDASFAADIELEGERASLRSVSGFEGDRRESWVRGSVNGGGPKVVATTKDGSVMLDLH